VDYFGTAKPAAPEHTTRPRGRRRWLVVLLAVLLYVGVVAGVSVARRPKHETNPDVVPRSLATGDGQLLLMTSDGRIEASDPGGQNARPLPSLGTFPGPASTGADGHLIAVGNNGQLDALIAEQPVVAAVRIDLSGITGAPVVDTFADGDRALIIIGPGDSEIDDAISLLTLHPAGITPLGSGDDAAGDPQTPGAFVSVPAADQPTAAPGGIAGFADTRIELRVPSRAPVVVVTAAALLRDLGQNPTSRVHLSTYPDPRGDKLAVVADPISGADSNAPVAVVDRHGKLLGMVGADLGPTEYLPIAWSPDGKSLAYTTFGPRGAALAVWTPGHSPKVRVAPNAGDSFSGCLWAPNGTEILCPNVVGVGQSSEWLVAASHGGALYLAHALGVPMAWLPGPIRT
jgi:WD40-like Beta Propeller Repeat